MKRIGHRPSSNPFAGSLGRGRRPSFGELVSGCNAVFRGETEEDIIRQASEHSKTAHNVHEIPKNLRKKMHRLIRDEKKAP